MADLEDPDFWRVKEIYMFTDLYLKRRNDEFREGGADLKQCANIRDYTDLKWPPLWRLNLTRAALNERAPVDVVKGLWQEFFVTLNRTRAALKEINQDLSLPDALEVEKRALVDVVEDLWFCLCIVFQFNNGDPDTAKRLRAADIIRHTCVDCYFDGSIPAIFFCAFLYSHLFWFIKGKGADHGMRSQAIDKIQFQAIEKKFEAINDALDLDGIPKDLDLDELYELMPVKDESDGFLGEGVQGKVYKRVLRDEEVAVKEVSRASLKMLVSSSSVAWGSSTSEGAMRDLRLDREVRILDWLKHPNVVELKGVTRRVEGTGMYGLVMELMDKTLEDLISQEVMEMETEASFIEPPPLGDVLTIDILLQVARGMRFLHSSKVVHRDLKTSNVLIGLPDPSVPGDALKVKLADFGLAAPYRALGDQESAGDYLGMADFGLAGSPCASEEEEEEESGDYLGTTLYMADSGLSASSSSSEAQGDQESTYKMGTSFYMAPELRWHPQVPYTTKADVFSFGSICFRLGTGMPLDQHHLQLRTCEFYDKIEQGSLSDLLSKCPKYLVPLLKRCWSADPEGRPDFSYICEALLSLKRQALLGLDLVSPFPSNWWCTASKPDHVPQIIQYIRELPSHHVPKILEYLGFEESVDFLDSPPKFLGFEESVDFLDSPSFRIIFSHKKRWCAIM